MIDIEHLKYPIGKFQFDPDSAEENLKEAIEQIKLLPENLNKALRNLNESQINTPYRPGGWTVRQVVHHIADSHMNALIRFKLALTEDNPTIKPYDEAAWAKMSDYELAVNPSLDLIRIIHFKWVVLLEKMELSDFHKTYYHPENKRQQSLLEVALMYSWHSQHHLAHIQHLAIRENWVTK